MDNPINTESGWVEWKGGKCPVRGKTVDLILRDGSVVLNEYADLWCGDYYDDQPCTPDNDNWIHDGSDVDIVRYRIVGEAK